MSFSKGSQLPSVQKHFRLLSGIGERTKLICFQRLNQVIEHELTKPRTAFLSPEDHFESDWKVFRGAMKKTSVTYGHNKKEYYNVLQRSLGYTVTDGLPHMHKNHPLSRLKAIVESGILDAWKRWRGLAVGRDKEKSAKPPNARVSMGAV